MYFPSLYAIFIHLQTGPPTAFPAMAAAIADAPASALLAVGAVVYRLIAVRWLQGKAERRLQVEARQMAETETRTIGLLRLALLAPDEIRASILDEMRSCLDE